jgi:hypothetical protein
VSDRPEIWEVADALQQDLRAASAKLVELRSQLAAVNLTDTRARCLVCGYRSSMNLPSVAEHVEIKHPELLTV